MTQTFPDDHYDPHDCQVILAITGTKEGIKQRLLEIVKNLDKDGKPIQGNISNFWTVSTVITPVWNGEKYK
jgi:hypothetical protein